MVMKQRRRAFVDTLDFITSLGHGTGGNHRQRLGLTTKGPTLMITDLCVMKPDPVTKAFVVASIHPGITRGDIIENTGWAIQFGDSVSMTEPPNAEELAVLRDLKARTALAHAKTV